MGQYLGIGLLLMPSSSEEVLLEFNSNNRSLKVGYLDTHDVSCATMKAEIEMMHLQARKQEGLPTTGCQKLRIALLEPSELSKSGF